MAGFGRSKFGRGSFGRSDLGKDLIVDLYNDDYLGTDINGDPLPVGTDLKNNSIDPLLMMLETYAHSVNKRRIDVENMKTLTDYEKASTDILLLLGDMLGLGIDKNDPDFLQRTFAGNASQWLQIKGTNRGYQVRGLASGFSVTIDNFWRISDAYIPYIPPRNIFHLRPHNVDPTASYLLHTDMPPGSFSGTPASDDPTYAKSSFMRVVFSIAEPRRTDFDYNKLLDLVIDKIKDVVAIHQEVAAQFLTKSSINVPIIVNIDQINETISDYQFNEFNRFDIVAADEAQCDSNEMGFTTA